MMTVTFSIAGTKITIHPQTNDPYTLDLGFAISAAVSASSSNLLFVLVDLPIDAVTEPNLFCINTLSGKMEWALAAPKVRSKDNIFTGLKLKNDDEILVWDWDGYRTVLDANDGKQKDCHFYK
jgi:outer membrane protein assembly factor BamB